MVFDLRLFIILDNMSSHIIKPYSCLCQECISMILNSKDHARNTLWYDINLTRPNKMNQVSDKINLFEEDNTLEGEIKLFSEIYSLYISDPEFFSNLLMMFL